MPYCDQAQIETRYGAQLLTDLSDRDGFASGAIDAALFARAIADADALIDGYIAGRAALPLIEVPALVTDLSQRIAIYYAHGSVVADKIKADYEIALRQLKDIASGSIKLPLASGAEATSSGALEILTNEPERPFTNESMKGFI